MATKNLALIFAKVPTNYPTAGEHLQVRDIGFNFDRDTPPKGMVLELLYCSFDPYQRTLLRNADINSYSDAAPLGKPLISFSLAEVHVSTLPDYRVGDVVSALLPVQQYCTLTDEDDRPCKIDPNATKDIRHHLGALGMPGLTAYSSLYEIGKPKKGETIFVSSAAGAVGQIVGQLAKREGMKVIGSVGSDEKAKFITETLGFDGGWNYKRESAAEALHRLAPQGIDVFYDNVGAEQLEAAINHMNNFGRIVESGQIAEYNRPVNERYPIRNLMETVTKRLTIRGFIVMDDNMKIPYEKPHQTDVTNWLNDGSIKAQTHEWQGMENAADAFIGMLKGDNFGKAVLKIKI